MIIPRDAEIYRIIGNGGVVIGGCGRSGTTLLLSVLSCHPSFCAIPEETQAFFDYSLHQACDPVRMDRLISALRRCHITPQHTHFVEKTPRNVYAFENVLEHFGDNVRLIHLVRDGRDVITSRHPKNPDAFWIPPERWVADVESGLRWLGHPQVHMLSYEHLVLRTEETLSDLCTFLGIGFTGTFLAYPEGASIRSDAAWFGEACGLHGRSIGRWRDARYAPQVQRLLAMPRARELLMRLGYAS